MWSRDLDARDLDPRDLAARGVGGRRWGARLARLALVMTLAGTTAACFQPLYGERTLAGGSAVRDAMAAVDVAQIDAPKGTPLSRIAVETRNRLVFDLTGGGGGAPQTHRLVIRLVPSRSTIILDPLTLRTEFDNFSLDASYTMVEVASGKTVLNGTATTRVTYNVPGQEQRFMRTRGLRDAETRASELIADQIKSRLASYFVAGT
jgi:LPS-assembly lipoprotein